MIVGRINAVRKTGLPNRVSLRIPVHTQWNINLLDQLLSDYEDKDIVEWLKFGWPIGFQQGTVQPAWAEQNHGSACNHPVAVKKYIDKELSYGSTIGPFKAPPFDYPIGKSAISTRSKRDSMERRILMDFSFPIGQSINDQLSSTHYLGQEMCYDYPSVDVLARRTAQLGPLALLWKADIKRCFKQIFICYKDVPLQGFCWDGLWYFDTSLIMGCRTAPYITMRCTSAISYIHRQMGYFTVSYADDFSGAELGAQAYASYSSFLRLLHDLNIKEAEEKSVPPSPVIIFLGTGIDAQAQTIFVIPERVLELQYQLETWRFKTWCTRRQLESIIGKLQFCTNCVRAGRVFINRLLNALRQMDRHRYYIVEYQVRLDLKWWYNFLPRFKSRYILWPQEFKTPGEFIATDASKKALAGVCLKNYFHTRIPEWMNPKSGNIANFEFLAIVISFKLWTAQLAGKRVVLECDNLAVVHVINYGRAKDKFLQDCLRELIMICCCNSIEIEAKHVSTHLNVLPDILSRWYHGAEYRRRFRRLTANKGYKKQYVKPEMFQFVNQW